MSIVRRPVANHPLLCTLLRFARMSELYHSNKFSFDETHLPPKTRHVTGCLMEAFGLESSIVSICPRRWMYILIKPVRELQLVCLSKFSSIPIRNILRSFLCVHSSPFSISIVKRPAANNPLLCRRFARAMSCPFFIRCDGIQHQRPSY